MARQNGVWIEFEPTSQRIERPHSSEIKALRSAITNSNSAVFVEFGDDLPTALAKEAEVTAAPAPKPRAPRAPKPVEPVTEPTDE